MAGMKRKFPSGGSSAWSTPLKKRQKAFRGIKKIGRSKPYGPELKCVDIKPDVMAFQSAAQFQLLNAIQDGSGFFQRVGRKVNMKSLMLTMNIEPTLTNPGNVPQQYARVVVFYDAQPNGVAPVYSDVLQDVTQTGATSISAYSSINLNNRDRFKILLDKKIKLSAKGINGAPFVTGDNDVYEQNTKLNITKYLKLRGLETVFKSTSSPSTIADISTGALWCMVFGEDANAFPNCAWQGILTTRLRYYDI